MFVAITRRTTGVNPNVLTDAELHTIRQAVGTFTSFRLLPLARENVISVPVMLRFSFQTPSANAQWWEGRRQPTMIGRTNLEFIAIQVDEIHAVDFSTQSR
jgi:hypothetical protein